MNSPYVDQYGQITSAHWPGKVESDTDLTGSVIGESAKLKAWALPVGAYDSYGGFLHAGWHLAGTGYFRLFRRGKMWWLISPIGNPCFYRGLDTAPAFRWETTPISGREGLFGNLPSKDGLFAPAWGGDAWGVDPGVTSFAFCTSNLIRKYGPDWQTEFDSITRQRLIAWGFTGYGKWSDSTGGVPSLPVLNRTGVPLLPNGRHPDPFDPATQVKLNAVLSAQVLPHLTDPNIVAWTIGNEYDELVTTDEIRNILIDRPDVAAKRSLIDYAVGTIYGGSPGRVANAWNLLNGPPATRERLYDSYADDVPENDLETLRRFFADRYYALLQQTLKSIDPNHLYAGSWTVPAYWTNASDWWLASRYCDVTGIDNYSLNFADPVVARLIQASGKPVLCGEFAFPQSEPERGYSNFGDLSLKDETASGKAYVNYVDGASENPSCVGVCWFQYRDQPATGRGPGSGPEIVYGENYPFGLVDIADNPKWTLLGYVRSENLSADIKRLTVR